MHSDQMRREAISISESMTQLLYLCAGCSIDLPVVPFYTATYNCLNTNINFSEGVLKDNKCATCKLVLLY